VGVCGVCGAPRASRVRIAARTGRHIGTVVWAIVAIAWGRELVEEIVLDGGGERTAIPVRHGEL
jgi:hypothetical protein